MFEAYSVAVKLTLINSVSSGLLMISKHLQTTGQDVDKLNSKLASIGKQAAVGGLMFAGGAAMTGLLKAPLEEARKFQNETQRFRSLGLGDTVTNDAVQFAKGMNTYGTSIRENLGLLRDAQTVFGDFHEAKMVAPLLARMKFANAALYGDEGGAMKDKAFMDMMKVIELRGGLTSESAFNAQANMVQQVQTATGGRVGANEFLNFIKTGGVAAKGLKDENFYYGMEPLIQEMGGQRVGTGLMSAYQNLVQGRTTQRAANELMRLGMINPAMVDYDKVGNIKQIKPGALKGSDMMVSDPMKWMQTVMLPAFAGKGITDRQAVLNEIGAIFTNRTASQLYSTMYTQQANIAKNYRLNSGAAGIDELEKNAKNSLTGKQIELAKKWDDLQLKLGEVILPMAITALDKLNPALIKLGTWIDTHPKTVTALTYAFVGLSAFLIGGGLINMVIAAGRAFSILGGVLLANPIGLTITAIAAAAWLVWNNWKEIKASLIGIWTDIKDGVVKLFHGDLLGGLTSFAHAFLLGWQVVFNTLIAGVNTILPAGLQIPKTHFADDFPRGGQAASGSPLVVPVPPRQSQPIEVRSSIILDGKKVGESVSMHQAREASRPRTGTQGFDPTRSMLLPGTPSVVVPRG
ncbi:hypothetical protein [Pseudomonas knackmussii]|uniref:hypothetical protein n=1 Tax=Pseudomonas knackmussii TaxID=65741 RepID=UPI003F49E632